MIREKKWRIKDSDKAIVEKLSTELNIGEVISQLLVSRGIYEEGPAKDFLFPEYKNTNDPYLLKDMDISVDRILQAVENHENIWIFGDYDVDGITSISVLVKFFKSIGIDVNYYIPDRFDEGYGLSKEGIDKISSNGGNLIITVDCGITSVDLVDYTRSLAIDIIITDHHKPQDILPRANAVINPHRSDCTYPFKVLAGVGVAFKLVQAINMRLGNDIYSPDFFNEYLDIVSLGTIADIVPLVGENRMFVKIGLDLIRNNSSEGIKELITDSSIDPKEITAGRIGYSIAPKINASGRIGDPTKSVELLVGDDLNNKIVIAKELHEYNKERQEIEKSILSEAMIQIESMGYEKDDIIVVAGENWNSGVVGIVSSRISEKYYKPSIVLSIDGENAKGSARSVGNFSIFDALNSCKDMLIKFGGHSAAAGLTLNKNDVSELRERLNKYSEENMSPEDRIETVKIDLQLDIRDISHDLLKEIDLIKPYGMRNPRPVFSTVGLSIDRVRFVGKDESHLKLTVEKENRIFEGIGFNMPQFKNYLGKGDSLDLAYTLDTNSFMGVTSIQLGIKDMKLYDISSFLATKAGVDYVLSKYNTLFRNKADSLSFDIPNMNVRRNVEPEINTLYVISSINGFQEILNIVSSYKLDGEFAINYGKITEIKDFTIIVNPLDKDKFDTFKNVVYYDYCDSINFDYKGHMMYHKNDIESLKYFYENIVFSRRELIDIYKDIKATKSVELIELFSKKSKYDPIKFMSGIIVLKKNGLIDYNIDGGTLIIKNIENNGKKVDIFNSKIYSFIKSISDYFINNKLNIEII